MSIRLIIVGLFQLFIFSTLSQTSIKFTKPQKAFLYTQLNLHGGGFFDGDEINFNAASKGIRNRVVTQAFFRSGKTLQKGYIRKFGIRNACFAMSLDYDPFYGTTNSGAVQLRLMDNWIGIGTKKSRRNFWLGNRRLEYGRNHRMDGEANFMNRNSLQVRDFGFWWDLGCVYRSPIIKNPENRWDVTLQLSSGGWLFNGAGSQGTLMYMGTDSRNDSINYLSFSGGDMKYQNTFLAIANFGRPTYKQKELNFFGILGNIRDQFNLTGTVMVGRVGAEYTIKMKESFKMGNQISIGQNFYDESGRNCFTTHVNNSLDISLNSKLAFGICQYIGFYKAMDSNQKNYFDYSIVSSLAYIVNPDIKFRFNMFYDNEDHWNNRSHVGAYLQLVAGFGKRL